MFFSRPSLTNQRSPVADRSQKTKSALYLGAEDPTRAQYSWTQVDENDVAQFVVVNEPALPNWMGSCHPNGSLYEKPLDLRAAQAEHQRFREELERNGCVVKTVREILAQDCEENEVARVALEDLAKKCLQYKLDEVGELSEMEGTEAMEAQHLLEEASGGVETLTAREKYLISEDYKKECVEKMDVEQLVEVVLTNPTIHLKKADKDTELLVVNYTYEPLVNLVFCRDQQITTAKGVVMGRPRSPIRQREVEVMKFCFEKLGVPIVGQISFPGTLEGGDFFPVGQDLAMIGVGLRSNMDAVEYLFQNNLFGTRRVAVVKDYFDQHQQRMHLDTVFNIIGHKVCLMLDIIQGENSPLRRLVDEYVFHEEDGKYYLHEHDIEFRKYMTREGYSIINVSESMQEAYGCNGLNLGNNTMVTVDRVTAKHIARSGLFNGKIIVVDFTNNTNMFGSVHCCSQVISRRPAAGNLSSEFAGFKPISVGLNASSSSSGSLDQVNHESTEVDKLKEELRKTRLELEALQNATKSTEAKTRPTEGKIPTIATHTAMDRQNSPQYPSQVQNLQKPMVTLSPRSYDPVDLAGKPSYTEALTPTEASRSKDGMTPNRFFMIAPDNFDINWVTAKDNVLMAGAHSEYRKLTQHTRTGKRGVYAAMLKQYAELHRVLTVDLGLEVFLATHESFHSTPDALYTADWFSTHPGDIKTCQDNKTSPLRPTLVLYSMKATTRRHEKRPDLLRLLAGGYPNVIDFSAGEMGSSEVRNTLPSLPSCSLTSSRRVSTSEPACKPLEFSSFVLDRSSHIAYVAKGCKRLDEELMQKWADALGYTIFYFGLHDASTSTHAPLLHQLQHTRVLLGIHSKFNLLCTEAVAPQDRPALLKSLASNGRITVDITLAQVAQFAITGCIEVLDQSSKYVLVASERALASFTKEQIEQIQSVGTRILSVNVSTIETLGGGSLSGMIAGLF